MRYDGSYRLLKKGSELRLVHQTFFVLAIVVLIAVGSMAALFALTLESGFIGYVNARQQEQFDSFHRLLVSRVEQDGSLEPVMRNEFMWRRMMRQAEGETDSGPPLDDFRDGGMRRKGYGRDGGGRVPDNRPLANDRQLDAKSAPAHDLSPTAGIDDRPPAPPSRADDRPPTAPRADDRPPAPPPRGDFNDNDRVDRGPPRKGMNGPRGRKGPPAENPYGLGQNIVLLAADRSPVYLSPRTIVRNVTPVERPVKVGDKVEGYVQLWPIEKLERPEDLAYLRAQYRNLAWGTGALVLLMLAVAPLVASRVTRPLRTVAAATERIAHGDLDVRLPTTRTDEIGALMVNVNGMVDSLQRLEQTRKRWIAEIAHELRTPLTVLQAELEALAVGVRPLEPQAISALQDETRQLTRLVGDLHQLALADLDALPMTMGPVDIADLARRVVDRFRTQAEGKGLHLELDVPGGSIDIDADAQRLEQLLGNLLQNSIRYTDTPGRVVVRARGSSGAVELVVDDSPPGVATGDLQRLFDPLYRADQARSRKSGGSGLGLAIARAIVVAHGGTITASPSPLGGLRLSATLPTR